MMDWGGVQTHQPAAVGSGEGGEIATDHYFSIRLERRAVDEIGGTAAGIKTFVHRAIRIQPCDPMTGHISKGVEFAHDNDFSIRLHQQAAHVFIRASADGEGCVHGAVRVQPRHMRRRLAVYGIEITSDDNCAVALYGDGSDRAVGTGAAVEMA